jgi:hypothetical protein
MFVGQIEPPSEEALGKFFPSGLTEWCKLYNITIGAVHNRMKCGMTVVEALTTPKAARFL